MIVSTLVHRSPETQSTQGSNLDPSHHALKPELPAELLTDLLRMHEMLARATERRYVDLSSKWTDGEDIASEAIAKVLTSGVLPSVFNDRGLGGSKNYLRKAAQTTALDWLRRNTGGRQNVSSQEAYDSSDPNSPLASFAAETNHANNTDLRVSLTGRLRELIENGDVSHEQVQAFTLAVIYGMSYAEIAKQQGVKPGTVKSRVSRLREALQADPEIRELYASLRDKQ